MKIMAKMFIVCYVIGIAMAFGGVLYAAINNDYKAVHEYEYTAQYERPRRQEEIRVVSLSETNEPQRFVTPTIFEYIPHCEIVEQCLHFYEIDEEFYVEHEPEQLMQHTSFTDAEICLVARLVWAEARGEGEFGQRAVVHVVVNRLNDPAFPNTIHGVVYERVGGFFQFTPVLNRQIYRADVCDALMLTVIQALTECDPTGGATFFRQVAGANNSWHQRNLLQLFDYGGHRFYRAR